MNIDVDLLKQAESHLGINTPYQKGINISVENCWHFSTDGNFIDRIFDDDQDFKDGMNRIFIVSKGYKIIVLAFCLMDTHIHFILYGKFDECNGFVHKYVSHTSRNINMRHGIVQKLLHLPIHYQKIDNDFYLKVAICYVLKNPPVAGLSFHSYDYPWSSSALYFRGKNNWTSPVWTEESYQKTLGKLSVHSRRSLLKTRNVDFIDVKYCNGIIFPGEYVAYNLVEKIFKTHRSFNFFMCKARDEDVESKGGDISRLTVPIQEMRQYRNEICKELFNIESIRLLDTSKRLRLARVLKSRYNSSLKQIARLCGLLYSEVKDMI